MFLSDTRAILHRIAIENEDGKNYTYGELEDLSLEYGTKIPTRSLVLILSDYSIETVAFYYCQMTNHVVPILIDKNLDEELLSRIIMNYEPGFIWCSQNNSNKVQKFIVKKIFQRGEYIVFQTPFLGVKMHPDLALLLTTSGSTGSLKMVRLSYDNLREEGRGLGEILDIREDDKGISTMPMFFSYGLSTLHIHWMVGACMYVTEASMLNVDFWKLFKKAKITNFAGVPYTYDILKQIDFLDQQYDSIRFMTQGGGKLSDERQKEFGSGLREKNIKLYILYGQTESMGGITALSHEKILDKLGSVGTAIPGMDIDVIGSDEMGIGEIVCKGKCVCMGYSSDKFDLMRGNDNAGYLNTGDEGIIDDEGDIFIKGRKSRFVKVLGVRISLDELESILSLYLGVARIACRGVDNDIRIYHLKDCKEQEILKFCNKKLSIPKKMIKCKLIDEFPYTATGKIKYTDLFSK